MPATLFDNFPSHFALPVIVTNAFLSNFLVTTPLCNTFPTLYYFFVILCNNYCFNQNLRIETSDLAPNNLAYTNYTFAIAVKEYVKMDIKIF